MDMHHVPGTRTECEWQVLPRESNVEHETWLDTLNHHEKSICHAFDPPKWLEARVSGAVHLAQNPERRNSLSAAIKIARFGAAASSNAIAVSAWRTAVTEWLVRTPPHTFL